MTDEARSLPPLRFKRPDTCKHDQREIDPELPEITCAACGKVLDPYWCLRSQVLWDQYAEAKSKELGEACRQYDERRLHDRQRRHRIRGVVEP